MSTELERPSPALLDTQYPVKEIFENLPIEYTQVYRNIPLEREDSLLPVIILAGFSGSGKDSTFTPLLETGDAYHVVTATSRARREEKGEPECAYVWMREKREEESVEGYYENLVKEYSLIEYDDHYGNLYGLPAQSMEKQGMGMPVLRVDINGVVNHRKRLPRFGFQPITVAVMPDSWSQVYESIVKRGAECEEEALKRFYEDVGNVGLYRENINYFIHNSRESDIEGVTGLDLSVNGLRYLVSKYQNH